MGIDWKVGSLSVVAQERTEAHAFTLQFDRVEDRLRRVDPSLRLALARQKERDRFRIMTDPSPRHNTAQQEQHQTNKQTHTSIALPPDPLATMSSLRLAVRHARMHRSRLVSVTMLSLTVRGMSVMASSGSGSMAVPFRNNNDNPKRLASVSPTRANVRMLGFRGGGDGGDHHQKKKSFLSTFTGSGNDGGDLPSTLQGKPVQALVPPGSCQFGQDFTAVKLLQRWQVSDTSCVVRFGLPDPSRPLNLSTCACLLAKAEIDSGANAGSTEAVVRPYTPISTNAQIGSFDLLIKNYKENGTMSRYLCEDLREGDSVDFKHIDFNVKIQYPFANRRIGMIVGGTGITPMVQALHAILGDPNQDNGYTVDMLYGSRDSTDILGRELLDQWAENSNRRFRLTHILSGESAKSGWEGKTGHIDRAAIKEGLPGPDEDCMIFVCGPPPMYDALCGPRGEPELSGVLADMGYRADQVYKF